MRGPLILLAHSFRRVRTLVLVMGVLLAAFQVFLIIVARSLQSSNAFAQIGSMIPPFMREIMGPSITSFLSFDGLVCVGYFHLAVMGSLVALSMTLSTTPTSEIETGFMDLILARPLARHWIITRSILVTTVSTVALLVMMMIGTWGGLKTLAPRDVAWPAPGLILSLAANLGLLMLCWSGVAMAIGAASRRRSVAGALVGLLALATFLLDYIARAWPPAESVAWMSPFRYYSPFELLMGSPLPARNLIVLAGIAIAGFVLAYILFSRRDISQ
ncbi:MAG: ABC transporter permease [Acidobacteriia bacterium]|nr:ABC transporter permease [Terriglobia bacterium]